MSMVAIVSGEVLYDDELVTITAGRDYISDDCELGRLYPEMFKKAASTMRGPRRRAIRTGSARIQAGRERVPLPPAEVDLLAGRTPRFEVTLPSSVVSGIEREIAAVRGTLGDVEAGGYLLGDRGAIVLQVEAGPNSTHGRNSMKLDDTFARQSVEHHPHLRIVGNWHTHANAGGVPSSTDLQAFAAATTRTKPWVSLIATKGEIGFMTPELHAWVTLLDGDTFVCEPASILEP